MIEFVRILWRIHEPGGLIQSPNQQWRIVWLNTDTLWAFIPDHWGGLFGTRVVDIADRPLTIEGTVPSEVASSSGGKRSLMDSSDLERQRALECRRSTKLLKRSASR